MAGASENGRTSKRQLVSHSFLYYLRAADANTFVGLWPKENVYDVKEEKQNNLFVLN